VLHSHVVTYAALIAILAIVLSAILPELMIELRWIRDQFRRKSKHPH
jgi:hypothetical protein